MTNRPKYKLSELLEGHPSPAPAVGELVKRLNKFHDVSRPYWGGLRIDGYSICETLQQAIARIEQLEAGMERIKRVALAEDGIERSAIGAIIEVAQIARALLKDKESK